jgi:hypothetical protein
MPTVTPYNDGTWSRVIVVDVLLTTFAVNVVVGGLTRWV